MNAVKEKVQEYAEGDERWNKRRSVLSFRTTLSRDKDIYIVTFVSLLLMLLIGKFYGLSHLFDFSIYFNLLYLPLLGTLFAFTLFLIRFSIYSIIKRNLDPLRYYSNYIKNILRQPHEVIAFYMLFALVEVAGSAFTSLKYIIPSVHYFAYDALFSGIDQTLHFGITPWELTHSIFGSPLATSLFAFCYNLWFVVAFGSILYFLLKLKDIKLRKQFLITYILCWFLVGNVVALLLSSAGPCFAHLVDPTIEVYQPLFRKASAATGLDTQPSALR